MKENRNLLFAVLGIFLLDSTLHVLQWLEIASFSNLFLHLIRWIFIGLMGLYTWRLRSLTAAILLCMFL
ncbi:MAG: hypothetical protein ACK445_08310, partial [Bacteroidota bacterium]